ncbi:hypothetical protein HS125_17015 [bacterium]|nr:hypothetical protein [bacterium]
MAFTDLATVRLHTGLLDEERVPDELIEQRLADAHADILRDLAPAYAESTDAVLATAETELAAAYLLRSLALGAAFADKDLRSGDLTLRQRGRSGVLLAQAEAEERRAWGRLLPYLTKSAHPHRFTPVEPDGEGA